MFTTWQDLRLQGSIQRINRRLRARSPATAGTIWRLSIVVMGYCVRPPGAVAEFSRGLPAGEGLAGAGEVCDEFERFGLHGGDLEATEEEE